MKYSRTAITQLKRQYKSVLLKCAMLNAMIMIGAVGFASSAKADNPTPTRGAYAAYTITNGTADNYNFTTSDGLTTSYYKTNLSTLNLLNNINDSTAWLEGTQDSNNFSVVLPNNETRYFIYGYTKPAGWGDGARQVFGQNGNAAGNSTFYNNRTFNGLNSTVSGGAIYIQGNYQAEAGHGSNLVGTMTADFINNSITNTDTSEKGLGGAIHIWGPYAGIGTLNSNFINNHITYGTAKSGGGALAIGEGYNGGESTVGVINGNFINNYIDAPSNNFGGAIYYEGSGYGDGEITSIGQDPVHTTKFVGNHILGTGQGGAIYAVNKIGSIYADFIGNYIAGSSDNSRGGAISLIKTSDEKNVGSITGDFIGNYITTSANNGTAYGGAIYNNNIVGSITGDFIGNYVVSEQDATYGGAVYNTGTITNLTGNFIGNYANGKAVYGGAIHNKGTITNLNGKFIENDVYSNAPLGFQTDGGAIANTDNGIIENISGDFIRNKAHTYDTSRTSMMVSGGAIYNDGAKIGTINANFIENEAQREAGAIYNSGNSSDNKGIGTISGNFIKNKVTGEIARDTKGGAISNTGTINSITAANFTNNTVDSTNGRSGYGGAIYNSGTIGYYETTINEWTSEEETKLTGGGLLGSTFSGNSASTSGGAIYNEGTINIISANFDSNTAQFGGAVNNSGTIGIDNGYGFITDGGFVDASFTNNTATNSGGAIYSNAPSTPIRITAKTKNVTFSGNRGTNGAAIYNSSTGGTEISALGGNVTFTNNTPTNSAGYGIYSAATLGLLAKDGYTIKIDDSIDIENQYADITVNQGFDYTGTVELNGKIHFENSNSGIRVGMAGNDAGTLKLGTTPANDAYQYLQTAGNFTLDLQNEHAGDNLILSQLTGSATMKLNVDYDATANSMDKITVNGGSGIITLNAVNVMNDNASFVDGTEATYLDGAVRNNITVISDAIQSTVAGTTVYTFTPDSTTHGLLTVSRNDAPYTGDLINAIQDTETVHPTAYSMQDNFTADRNFGALNTENREQFTIFGNNHTISGNNTYTGIEVASGQTLNLDNVRFSDVKTYDVQNAGTLNLSGNNIINTITDADTPAGTTNITGGNTVLWNNSSITQKTVNLKGGNLRLNSNSAVTASIVADGSLDKTGFLSVTSDSAINGTISGTFKGNTEIALKNKGTIGAVNANFVNNNNEGHFGTAAIYNEGTIESISGNFTGNSKTSTATYVEGGAIYNSGTITNGIANSTFTGNSATSTSDNAYGGAIYQSGGTLNITGSTFGGSETGQGNSATSSASGKYGYGGAIYLTNATATITNSNFEKNSAMWGGAIYQNSGSLTLNNVTFKNNIGNIGSSIYQKSGTLSIVGSTFDDTNSGNLWQESGNLSITNSNFTNTSLESRLGSNVTITGSTFDNSPVHFLGKGNETSASNQNTFNIVNSTIKNTERSDSNAYALSVVGGDVTIDGVNIINNTNARGIKSEAAAQYGDFTTRYSKLNIIAQTADVNITGNKEGVHVIGWNNDDHYHTTLSLYAKNHDILISGNTDRGLSYYDQYGSLTLNADTSHNITINDSVSSNVGMTVNSDNNAGTVALNGALTLGSALNVNGGTLTLNDTAASSMANKDLVLNGGALKLDSVAASAIVNTNLGLNGGKFDIANNAIDNLTFTNAINNAVNSYIALDVSLGDTNTADKITSDISGASTVYVSDINFISDNKNGGDVQIADGNIKGVIAVGADVAGGYADVQYDNTTGILSFADKINWLEQTNGNQSGYRFTKTNNGIMPVNYASGENNYTFYTDILKKNYTDDNSVAHDLKYTWNNATHTLSVTNSDGSALSTTKSTIVRTGDGSESAPFVYTGDHVGNTAIGLNRWNNFGTITGDFVGNTNGAIAMGMGVDIPAITGNFIGNSGGRAFSFAGDHSWGSSVTSITGDFIGNSSGAIYISNWNKGGIGTITGDFIGNKADNGGAIWLADSHINSVIGNFVNNYAGDVGGALYVGDGHNGANISVTGDFIANQAVNRGGAVYSGSGASTTLVDTSFIGNIASEGAAIYTNAGELTVTALNKDIEFTNNNSTGLAGGDGYGIYHKAGGYRPFAINAYEGRTITVNDKVYSEQKINLNCYYSGDWVGKNGTVIFNNEFTQTGATEISSNEGNAGGGTVIFNGATSLGALDVSGTATLKLGAGAGTSTFGAVTFTRNPILDIANGSAQTLNVASIKNNAKLNIDLDFTGASVLADAINISTGGQTGVLTLDSINALTSETGAIRSFSDLEILKGTTTNVTLALSETLQQDERFFGDEVESVTREVSTFADNATFGQFEDNKFTDTVYAHKTQNRLYLDDTKTKLSFDSVETAAEYVKSSTSQDVLQSLNQSTSAARSLTTDDADATYTVGDNLGATGTGSLSVTGTTSGSDASTLNMNGKSGFELSNSDTTLALSNLNITGIKDVEGGLINITGTGSKANLENVTIASTTNSAISNAVELNLNGTNNIGTGITGTGTTNVNGGKTTIGSITQNAVNITAGELEVANITAANGISNAGTLTLTGTANANTISGVGTTVIKNNLNNTGAINQAVEIANTGTLTSNADNLGGTITNSGNLLLSGTLDKAIAGASGITKIDSNLKMTSTGSIEGTLALNGCNLDLSGDGAATQYTVNTLDESGHLKIDIDYSGATPIADSINIATTGGAGSVQLIDITEIGTAPGSFTVEVLKGNIGLKTLEISDSLAKRYRGVEETTITYESDDYLANINFDKTTFDTKEYTEKTQKTLSVVDNTKLKLDKVVTEAKHQTGVVSKDALAFINQNTDTSAVADRSMVTTDTNKTYTVQEDLGTTGAGTLLVQGASDKTTKLDMNNHSGFVVANSGTTVTLKDINVDNVQNTEGGLVNITNTGSSATLDTVSVNVKDNPENKANVISSNGTLGVTNSTVNAGVNNNGTMNLNGTNQIASVEGSNGTANVQTGTTTVGSIFQKLINIVTGGKLASNGDVTATSGITNNTAEGLSVANGTLTGNVTGAGSTKFSGTSSIADGSSVGQAITVVDGKLTTLADGLGGAVTNSGEVDLTGGTLETSITGGNTTISGNVGVDDTAGSIASAVSVATGAKLTTKADNVTGAINNGGNLDLTGGDIKNAISGDGNTTISGTVTNTTGSVIGNAVTVATTGNLTTAADKLGGAVENNGTTNGLTLTGGQLSQNVTGTGKTVIAGTDVSVKYGNSIAQDIEITSGNKLVNTNVSAIGGDVENNGDIQLYSQDNGKLEHDITGTGTTELNRDITVAANIDNTINIKSYTDGTGTHNANVTVESGNNFGKAGQNITVDSNNSLTMQSASDIKGNLVDNGTVELQGGTISNAISGTGTTNINGAVVNNNTIGNTVTIGSGASLSTAAAGLGGNVTSNAGTVELTGTGTLNNSIAGNTTITGDITNNGSLANVTVSGKLTSDADKVTGTVANSGTYTVTGGTIAKDVTGNGATVIDGTVVNGANIVNNVTVNNGKSLTSNADNISGTVANSGTYTVTGGTIASNITENGATVIDGTVQNNANIANNVTINSGKSLTTAANTIADVVNNGDLNLSGGTLSSAISGTGMTNINGDVTMATGSTLADTTIASGGSLDVGTNNVTLGNTTINGTVKMEITDMAKGSDSYTGGHLNVADLNLGSNSKLSMTVAQGLITEKNATTGAIDLISASGTQSGQFAEMLSNNRYKVTTTDDGKFQIAYTASSSDIVDEANGTPNNKATGEAWDNAGAMSGLAAAMQNRLNELSQHDAKGYVDALTNLAPTDSMVHVGITQDFNNLIGEQIASRLNREGLNSGDMFEHQGAWVQMLYNHSKQDDNSKNQGFTGKTAGVAFGLDGKVDDKLTIGVGYAYGQTDVDSLGRDTDVDGHTIYAYGKYQPSEWYVRGMVNYGFAKYEEKANVGGLMNKSKYDVQNYGARAFVGYDLPNGFTPEAGLRLTHIDRDNYTDSFGQHVKTDGIDVLTASMGVNYSTTVTTKDQKWSPKAHFALTYDLLSDDANATVNVANSVYDIKAEKLNRFGVEAGVGAEISVGNWDFSAEYDLGTRKDYLSHTGMLKAKYNF